MIPIRATYRLQFTPDFRFADGAALAPYLAALGISHVYASPVFAARTGSTHGYDVTDYNRLNPALGSLSDFGDMVQSLRDHGLGLILDIVPNHMGIGGADNVFWDSVLEWGQDSPYAHWFDIDWNAQGLAGKVLFPFLGKPYATALTDGDLVLRLDNSGRLAVWAHDTHRLPICPRDYANVLDATGSVLAPAFSQMINAASDDPRWSELFTHLGAERPDLSAFTDPARLDALIQCQHWRAAKYNLDADAINYRRFFTISDLAGVRVESAQVFADTHALVLSLVEQGLVDALRIDHIDGLRDPKAYCLRLRDATRNRVPIYVEKILGPDEHLPSDWQTQGTTGYEFANLVVTLLADPAGTADLNRIYHETTGRHDSPQQVVHDAKVFVLSGPMRAEREAVLDRIATLASRIPEWADLGRGAIRDGMVQTIAALDVYRTYADDDGISPEGRARLSAALDAARQHSPELDPAIWSLLAAVLSRDLAARLPDHRDDITEAAMRFQQLSGPVMAKGLEDRALYRFNRLIALNEVGSHPGQFNTTVAAFHQAQITRQRTAPHNMLATATHDTKRGEDARMRIMAIASHTGLWRQKVTEWTALLDDPRHPVDPSERYFFYQMLTGVWPDTVTELAPLKERVSAAMLKSVREAGVNSRWMFGDATYEDNITSMIDRAFASQAFLISFTEFMRRIAPDAEQASLIQTLLKLTVPGVPDIYQGAEMWDHSLVDPDNRRAVDFAKRTALLPDLTGGPVYVKDRSAEHIKLALIAALLRLRADHPALFSNGSYTPLRAEGPAADGFLGFVRRQGTEHLLVAARLHQALHDGSDWQNTRINLPEDTATNWINLIDMKPCDPRHARDLFQDLPFAALRAV
jgi:(1->4)-alpha-D-glucan 1-alpha-D-glucosylmutase